MLGLYYMPALYATCNAVMKFQYMNGFSYTHMHNNNNRNNDLLNALLECIKFTCICTLYFYLPKLLYPSDI